MSTVIYVENLGKKYLLSHQTQKQPYVAMRDVIAENCKSLGKKVLHPFRNLVSPATSPQPPVPASEDFWALKDVSFQIKHGERVGIIGRNGAGKSTLLKILSRIVEPTTGRVRIKGRVASLLEVGTGFHPELTGRENIYLNGAILGMGRAEIKKKFDEIVDFAEIEKFLDTPVKRYSSGMYVRLAFSVAAHLEPEILMVDEVLAVGDAQFQKKCLGKMEDVGKSGRTVLFVSHNMNVIRHLCSRSVLLSSGKFCLEGPSDEVINNYLQNMQARQTSVSLTSDPEKVMCLRNISVLDHEWNMVQQFELTRSFKVQIEYDVNKPISGAHVICFVHTADGTNVLGSGDADIHPQRFEKRDIGTYRGEFEIPPNLLGEGWYYLTVALGIPFVQVFERHEEILSFEIIDSSSTRRMTQSGRRPGILGLDLTWNVERIR